MKHARVIVQSTIDRATGNSLISIIDEDNGETICKVPLAYADFVDLTLKERHAIGANAEFIDWYKIGKRRVVSTMKFEMPHCHYILRDEIAADVARMNCPKGWSLLVRADRSQFVYEYKKMATYATCSICRYATDEELQQEQDHRDVHENTEKEAAEKDSRHQEVALV